MYSIKCILAKEVFILIKEYGTFNPIYLNIVSLQIALMLLEMYQFKIEVFGFMQQFVAT